MPDRSDGDPVDTPPSADPLERDIATAVWGRLAHERLARCHALLDLPVVRAVVEACSGTATGVEVAGFVLRRTLQGRRGDTWAAGRAIAGIDPPLVSLEDRREAASIYLRQRGTGPASSRTTRRYEYLVWQEIARALRALGQQSHAVQRLSREFASLQAPSRLVSNLPPAEADREAVDDRPVVVANARNAVFIGEDGFMALQRITRLLVAQQDRVNLIGFEIYYEGGYDALAPRVLRGGRFLDEPAIDHTAVGFRRYQVALDRTLNRGDRHEVQYEIRVSPTPGALQKTINASAFDSAQLPGFTLTTSAHFTHELPREVFRAVAPTGRWPRYATSRQALVPQLNVSTIFTEDECSAGTTVGIFWRLRDL